MSGQQTRDVEDAVLVSLTEEERAAWRREQGVKVIEHCGRYWEEKPVGFYHAIHWMARMTQKEAARPATLCWGFRTTLCEADRPMCNATLPVHVLNDIQSYDIQALSSRRRNKVRNCRKYAQIVELHKPDILREQGYEVLVSAHQRNRYGELPSLAQYRSSIESLFNPRRGLILASLIDGRLGGYVTAYAVGSTAYIDSVQLATAGLWTNMGTGLIYELIRAFRRSGTIKEVIYGLDSPEAPTLVKYKEEMGFPVIHIPAYSWIMPFMKEYIKDRRPFVYYRLTGHN